MLVVASGQAANVGVPVPAVNPVQSHHHAGKHRRGRKGRKPKIRSVRKRVPSQLQVLDVLLKCLPGDLRGGFDEFFSTCVKNEAESAKHVEPTICYTPIRWIADGLQEVLGLSGGGYPRFQIQQLESLREDDVFRPSGSVSSFARIHSDGCRLESSIDARRSCFRRLGLVIHRDGVGMSAYTTNLLVPASSARVRSESFDCGEALFPDAHDDPRAGGRFRHPQFHLWMAMATFFVWASPLT
ncbi:hypothetical protein MHU86_11528 [Fragilaria crotonensis]|nr:hypothetical protein MHU86_11528 [Fragilaria crotonensis]